MTPEILAGVVGVVIALLIELAVWKEWRFGDWFNSLPDGQQKLFTIGVGFVVVVVAFVLGCFSLIAVYWVCTTMGAWQALGVWLAYVLANQTTYALFLKKKQK